MLCNAKRRYQLMAIAMCVLILLPLPAFAFDVSTGGTTPWQEIVVGQPIGIEVQPASIVFNSRRQSMRVIVTGQYADGSKQDLSRIASINSQDMSTAAVTRSTSGTGMVGPIANGRTEIEIQVAGHRATISVQVEDFERPATMSFRHEVLAVLTKQGCNSGSCHGTLSGKGGFRLSLEAFDPQVDEVSLIREAAGRRTNLVEPEMSLLLRKPTMELAHDGGRRLQKRSPAYQVIHDWIAEGCRVDAQDSPQCVGLQIAPERHHLLTWPAHTQQLLVLAHFSDGTNRDVTDFVKITSSAPSIAMVAPDGMVTGLARGEAAIMVRYREYLEACHFTFVRPVEGFVWNDPMPANYIDSLVNQKLQQLQYMPAEVCSDSEFLRRVHLDVLGVPPSLERTKAFLADNDPQRRSKLIDELLDRSEYADFWAHKWADLLRVRKKSLGEEGLWKFHAWLVDAFRSNMPMDQFARELLTARGSTFQNPQANYFRAHPDAETATEATAQIFMGVRIQCAKCHNHPYERWTQDNYFGLTAFFNRVQSKPGSRIGESLIWISSQGEVVHPRTARIMKPWLPGVGVLKTATDGDRPSELADWLTGNENPLFAKVLVNRLWSHLMGRGIVEPVDDFRDSNPPANSELLDTLAEEFRNCGYDQKQILRRILNSQTYQHSSLGGEFNSSDEKYFSHAMLRPLSAEQLLDSIRHLTGVWDSFSRLPARTLASQLPSPDYANEFLKMFGQPERETSCACERSQDSNLAQALQLFNGSLVHDKLRASQNRFRDGISVGEADDEVLSQLYLAAYARYPDIEEVQVVIKHLDAQADRLVGWEDVCWTLLNSKEFLFQH